MAGIWPRLRKKLQQGKKSGPGKSQKGSKGVANPFAATGLEKFAALVEELQTKQQAASSLVERTASSLSAARSISRSAQEWTASTVVRAASRCTLDTTTKASSGDPPVELPVGEFEFRDSENLSEEGLARGCDQVVSFSNSSPPPLVARLPARRCRAVASKSAFVMLLAMCAFLSARAGKVGKPLATLLTFSAVIRIWRKGKVSARFMFSSLTLYLFTPLRSYLVTRIPKRLILTPRNPESSQDTASEVILPELHDQSGCPVATLSLLPVSETSPSSESLDPVTPPDVKIVAGSSSRRLAKRISSRLKKLRLFKSSSSATSVVSVLESPLSSPHAPSGPKSSASNHRRVCPFSRKLGDIAEVLPAKGPTPSSSSSHLGSHSKCKRLRRHNSSEHVSAGCSSSKGSRCGRKLSSETLEHYNQGREECSTASSSTCESRRSISSSSSRSSAVGEHEASAPVSWPMVGLLVTLLFLVVGRVPAIMATSLFLVVVSPHSRARDRRESRAFREAAARKLHHSPPPLPRGGRWAHSSPPRSF